MTDQEAAEWIERDNRDIRDWRYIELQSGLRHIELVHRCMNAFIAIGTIGTVVCLALGYQHLTAAIFGVEVVGVLFMGSKWSNRIWGIDR